jgi:hypothetical protein
MELYCSLLGLQELSTGLCPEPAESTQHPLIVYVV